jgi:hypothetical protein
MFKPVTSKRDSKGIKSELKPLVKNCRYPWFKRGEPLAVRSEKLPRQQKLASLFIFR